jgi:hypothetical protein
MQFHIQTRQPGDPLQHLPATVHMLPAVEVLFDRREVDPVHKILLGRDVYLIFYVHFSSPPHERTHQIAEWGRVAAVERSLHEDVPPSVKAVRVSAQENKQPEQICQNKHRILD